MVGHVPGIHEAPQVTGGTAGPNGSPKSMGHGEYKNDDPHEHHQKNQDSVKTVFVFSDTFCQLFKSNSGEESSELTYFSAVLRNFRVDYAGSGCKLQKGRFGAALQVSH